MNYTQKPASEYKAIQYTLNVVTVSADHFNTVGATYVSLSQDDPDYNLTADNPVNNPETDKTDVTKPDNSGQTNNQQSVNKGGASTGENKQNNKDINSMQTGDDFPIAFWMGLMIISFISIIILGRRSLKSDNN